MTVVEIEPHPFHFRLFDRERFLGLRADLVLLSTGKLTERIAGLVDEATAELQRPWWRAVPPDRVQHASEGIEAVRTALSQGGRIPSGTRGRAVEAVLDTLCHVRFEAWIMENSRKEGTFIEIDSERLLWALWRRIPWFEDWAWGSGPWIDRENDGFAWAEERAITVMSRADLERLHADVERIATEPNAVPEVVVENDARRMEHRARAFVAFRRLVGMAIEKPAYSLSLQVPL